MRRNSSQDPQPAPPPLLGHLDPEATVMVEDLMRASAPRIRTHLVNRVGQDLSILSVETEWTPLGPVLDRLPAVAVASGRVEAFGMDVLVTLESDLLTRLIGQILGQPNPDPRTSNGEERRLSRFDLLISRRIAEDVLTGMLTSFTTVEKPNVVFDEVGTSTRVGLGLSRTSFVCATTYEVEAPGGAAGRITVFLPTRITRIASPRRDVHPPEARVGLSRVLPLTVTAVAELRRLELPLSRLREIKPGLLLDLGPAKDVVVRVGDRATLYGEAGIQNTTRSVRVKGRIEGGVVR